MRYTVTITEHNDEIRSPDARVVRSTPHTGEAFEVLKAAVTYEIDYSLALEMEISRGPEGAIVGFAELVEAARLSATTPRARELWVDEMATLILGCVYDPEDRHYIRDDEGYSYPPSTEDWEATGRYWADLVTVPPPEDLIAALDKAITLGGYRIFDGYQTFVNVARQPTGTTSVTTSAVRRASAALEAPAAAPGIPPRSPTAPLPPSPAHEAPRRGQGRGL